MWFVILILSLCSVLITGSPTSKFDSKSNVKIVGGNITNIEEIPYQLQFEIDSELQCGATLIAPNWAVTAAHCTEGFDMENMQIRAGASKRGSGGQAVSIKKVHQHPDFDEPKAEYDIAILELAQNITLNKAAQPISLVDENVSFKEGTNCTISGWGSINEQSDLSDDLRMAFVPIVNHNVCMFKYFFKRRVTDRMICAGFVEKGGVDACQGDSGGPLVINGKLAGIVSWGYGCARKGFPGVYTNVSYVRSFIKEITKL